MVNYRSLEYAWTTLGEPAQWEYALKISVTEALYPVYSVRFPEEEALRAGGSSLVGLISEAEEVHGLGQG